MIQVNYLDFVNIARFHNQKLRKRIARYGAFVYNVRQFAAYGVGNFPKLVYVARVFRIHDQCGVRACADCVHRQIDHISPLMTIIVALFAAVK